jgi:UDP-2,3-diacylglucosamine hydrolase
LFEHWLGDDDAEDDFHRTLLDELAALARTGVAVAFLHGNRDFLLSAAVARRSGVALIADPTERTFFGVRTLLMHGDLLCTDDVRYQRYRARVRRPLVLRAFLAMPSFLRRAVAGGLRRVSESEKRIKPAEIMDVNLGAVEATLRTHGYPRLVHGHTHRPARHVHVVDGHTCERWVLGDWYERGSYLRCDERGCEAALLD